MNADELTFDVLENARYVNHLEWSVVNMIKVDDETYGRLSAVARMDQMSPEEEAAQLLRSAIDQRQERLVLVAEFRRIAAMTPKDVEQTDSVVLLREDRDR